METATEIGMHGHLSVCIDDDVVCAQLMLIVLQYKLCLQTHNYKSSHNRDELTELAYMHIVPSIPVSPLFKLAL